VRSILWAIPLKPFDRGKARLATAVDAGRRAELARNAATRVVEACRAVDGTPVVISSGDDVAAWAEDLDLRVLGDPGSLNGAAAVAAGAAGGHLRFAVLHGDLPLLQPEDLAAAVAAPADVILAPSHDGGTSLLISPVPLRFAYGPGSFRRHLAAAAQMSTRVLVRTGLAVDLDTPTDLTRAAATRRGAWLRVYLDPRPL
jgi:2-phospho-L-lactate guanylyltransferase